MKVNTVHLFYLFINQLDNETDYSLCKSIDQTREKKRAEVQHTRWSDLGKGCFQAHWNSRQSWTETGALHLEQSDTLQ